MASGDENNRTAEALGFGDAEAGGARGFAPSHFHFCRWCVSRFFGTSHVFAPFVFLCTPTDPHN